MAYWGANPHGDPCAECGFDWSMPGHEAAGLLIQTRELLQLLVRDANGQERRHPGAWTVAGHITRAADLLREWAEWVEGARRSNNRIVTGIDHAALSRARAADGRTLQGSLWSLDWAIRAWSEAIPAYVAAHGQLRHSAAGWLTAEEIARIGVHDTYHHVWDIGRILVSTRSHRRAGP